jgi:CrcB protein
VIVLWITLAGGLGATLRWLLDLFFAARYSRQLPWGTMTANVLGSCVAGSVAGASIAAHFGTTWTEVVAIGLCGGFTTFSAASVDIAREFERRRVGLGIVLLLAPMVVAVAAGVGGFLAASA